jgi:hypothetical protein
MAANAFMFFHLDSLCCYFNDKWFVPLSDADFYVVAYVKVIRLHIRIVMVSRVLPVTASNVSNNSPVYASVKFV